MIAIIAVARLRAGGSAQGPAVPGSVGPSVWMDPLQCAELAQLQGNCIPLVPAEHSNDDVGDMDGHTARDWSGRPRL
jgi:hypothetical protein